MRDRLDEFVPGTEFALVTFTARGQASSYQRRNEVPFPVLIDPELSAYHQFGFERGSVWRVWGWRAARRYVQLFRTGGWRELRKPSEDTLQLGGDVVVDPDGTVGYLFHGDGPDDRPSVDDLIAAVEASHA